jgi:5-methylcytosine-specific restriction enzyme A
VKLCAEAYCPQPTTRTRCAEHERQAERVKAARRPTMRTYAETKRRAEAVAVHVAAYGWWCPGWGDQPPHPSRDLTADHAVAVAAGGPEDGPLRVLCRPCNSRRGTG